MTTAATASRFDAGAGRVARRPKKRRPWILFIAPFFVAFLVFFIAPIVYALYESLFKTARSGLLGAATTRFAGLENYAQAFRDSGFVSSLWRMLLFGVVEVPVTVVLALVLALLLDSASARFKQFFRVAFFLPYGVPGVVAALLWGFLYTPSLSPIIAILRPLGVDVDFYSQQSTLWSIANIVVWTFAGYNTLVLIAQLQSISPDVFEAARVDGASGWRIAWQIKVPLIRPAIIMNAMFSIIGCLQLFAEPLVLQPNDSNISSDYTPNMSVYDQAFNNNNYNYAAAQSVILAVIALIVSFGFLRLSQRGGRDDV